MKLALLALFASVIPAFAQQGIPHQLPPDPSISWNSTLTKLGIETKGIEFYDLHDAGYLWAEGKQGGVEPPYIQTLKAQYGNSGVALCVTDAPLGCFFAISRDAAKTGNTFFISLGIVGLVHIMPITYDQAVKVN